MNNATDTVRISDADRERAATILRDSVSAGRLSLTEFDERLRAAYAATTRQELATLVADLPQAEQPAALATRPASRPHRVEQWRGWAGGALLLVGIWAVGSLAAGHALFFWPAIPLVFWAVSLVGRGQRHGCSAATSRQ